MVDVLTETEEDSFVRVMADDGVSYSVVKEEASVVERLRSLGFRMDYRFASQWNFSREVKGVKISGFYNPSSQDSRYLLSVYFGEDKKTWKARKLEGSVRDSLKDLGARAEQIAKERARAAGIPEGVRAGSVDLDFSVVSLLTEGSDFDKTYEKLRRASRAMGINI